MADLKPFRIEKRQEEISMFNVLGSGELGRTLAVYVRRLGAALCDLRSMQNDIGTPAGQIEAQARKLAERILEENLVREILQRSSKKKAPEKNPFM